MSEATSTKELGKAQELSADELLRQVVSEMFDNDNDTTLLVATLTNHDGSESTLEFQIKVTSINGIRTRDTEDEDLN